MTPEQDAAFRAAADGKQGDVRPVSSPSSTWPRPLSDEAFHGLAGEIVREIEPHSEADPAWLLMAVLVAFGNACGRGPGFEVGGTFHATNLFAVAVGRTSDGRKGTGWDAVGPLFERADATWAGECVQSGLSSGEGLVHAVRDPSMKQVAVKEKDKPTKYVEEIEDHGACDKRLLAREAEFASVLRVMGRDHSTLSTTVRTLWDAGKVRTLTKGKPERATGAHVSIVGDITPEELRRELDDTSAANGFANRFLFVAAKRSRELPFGGSPDDDTLERLGSALCSSLRVAEDQGVVPMDDAAAALWQSRYGALTRGHPGMFGAVTGRAAPQVRRLATVYALTDGRREVTEPDLRAALELWRYCEDTARYVFGDRLGDHVADRLLEALRDAGTEGMSRTDMRGLLGGKLSGERIDSALATLHELGLAECQKQRTAGRSVERWSRVEQRDKTEESSGDEGLSYVSYVSSTPEPELSSQAQMSLLVGLDGAPAGEPTPNECRCEHAIPSDDGRCHKCGRELP
jgi:hypothetical protein